ncbi:hypothetical protein GQR36_04775 [Enterococcus termitis]
MGQAALIIALGLVLSACGTSANMSKSSKESTKTEQTSSSKEPVKASESDVKESEKKRLKRKMALFLLFYLKVGKKLNQLS